MYKYKITICTPTYNRAELLKRLYKSIKAQTYKDFEWIIIDDGSSDDTESVCRSFIDDKERQFPITYCKRENGGKHRAVNDGLDRASGELFFIMDSDDYLTPDALEKIAEWESTVKNDKSFCAVAGQKGTGENETANKRIPRPYIDISLKERLSESELLAGEHAEAFYTDIFKKYKFPEFPGENFLAECASYDKMFRDGYKIRYFDDIIWIYEYLPDGLTKNIKEIHKKNPKGYGYIIRQSLDIKKASPKERFMTYYSFYCDMIPDYKAREIAGFIEGKKPVFVLIEMIFKVKRSLNKISDKLAPPRD